MLDLHPFMTAALVAAALALVAAALVPAARRAALDAREEYLLAQRALTCQPGSLTWTADMTLRGLTWRWTVRAESADGVVATCTGTAPDAFSAHRAARAKADDMALVLTGAPRPRAVLRAARMDTHPTERRLALVRA